MLDLLHRGPDWPLIIGRAAAVAALAFAAAPLLASTAQAASPVPLGTADSFALLAGSTITNVGPSTISGDIGLCCTGLATPGLELATQPRGARYIGTGGVAASAQDDLDIGYANAASQAVTATLPVDLSLAGTPATPLLPGVYESTSHGALEINTGLTLDFQGNPNAVFIFQGSSLTTAAAGAGSIRIVNGGSAPSACNIFWQLSDATQGVTLGAASAFKGTTMSLGASVLGTGATVEGRILTRRSKAVTLLANTITQSPCATTSGNTVTPTPTPIATSSIPGGTSVPLVTTAALPSVKPTVAAKPVAVPIAGPLLSGPSAPVRGPFVVSVTGHAIESVVFYVDGRRVSKVHARPGRTVFKLRIDPRHQNRKIHRVTARIRTRTTKTTLRIVYRRPPVSPRPPQFTG
jgi:hypothetical protein